MRPTIVWFRRDLRLSDNLALAEAASLGKPVIALYVYDTNEEAHMGGASQWWLHHSLKALAKSLQEKGLQLVLRRGDPLTIITQLQQETNASHILWGRLYSAYERQLGEKLKKHFSDSDIITSSFNNSLLFEPWTVLKDNEPYKVFTPWWKKAISGEIDFKYTKAPSSIKPYKNIASDTLNEWQLISPHWGHKFDDQWTPGEQGGKKRFNFFLHHLIENYAKDRDLFAKDGTSKLSPHLHFGEISPRYCWQRVYDAGYSLKNKGAESFLRELGWREYSYYLLYHFPTLPTENWRDIYNNMPWSQSKADLKAWQTGQTGIPLIDAAMRALWATGWMHNRLRMGVGSFLTKNLGHHWKKGLAWFDDTLVDADEASNAAGWQWIAGSGADAAPYFRIFNPTSQSEKFDPEGTYIKQWVPELQHVPAAYIHAPWEHAEKLKSYGVELGKDYPHPLVDLKRSRQEALDRYAEFVKKA